MYKLKYPSVKLYNTMQNIATAKYVINYHDGKKAHPDGSRFFDIRIYKKKKEFEKFEKELKNEGYVYGHSTFVSPPQTTPPLSISDKKESDTKDVLSFDEIISELEKYEDQNYDLETDLTAPAFYEGVNSFFIDVDSKTVILNDYDNQDTAYTGINITLLAELQRYCHTNLSFVGGPEKEEKLKEELVVGKFKEEILKEVFYETPSNISLQEESDWDKIMRLDSSCDISEFGYDLNEMFQELEVEEVQKELNDKLITKLGNQQKVELDKEVEAMSSDEIRVEMDNLAFQSMQKETNLN